MEKRVLLAVVLSFIVLYAFQALFPPPKPQTTPAARPTASQAETTTKPSATVEAPAEAPAQLTSAPLVADTSEHDVIVDTDAVHAVFTTRGGNLKNWQLKKYADDAGHPLELVPQDVPVGRAWPFTLSVADPAVNTTLAHALYKPGRSEIRAGQKTESLRFDYRDASGLTVVKEFTFSPSEPYVIRFSAKVTNGSEIVPVIHWGPALGNGRVENTRTYNPSSQAIFYRDAKVTRVKPTQVQEHALEQGLFGFAGVDDHYFLTSTVASGLPLKVTYQPVEVPIPGSQTPAHFVDWTVQTTASPSDVRFFAGPKDFDVLVAVDRDLVRSIDFGLFSWLVVPLLRALKWVNHYVGNYGWSIILLTVLINLAMFPLRHKSVVSMRKMQDIQPEMKAIQDRYAKLKMSDPQRQKMNVELMNLYRERGVNPASGCVPMLLTLPVLFAFYSMLSVAIELRGAPFIGWIKDLSVHDPLFITPVLMGITQFVQARMTPSTADPAQQKMMMFMPLIFMTMFIWAPSGLVLYWTASNLWGIGQQVLTNRLIGPSAQRTVRPPAERRLKTVGAGKTDQASKERK